MAQRRFGVLTTLVIAITLVLAGCGGSPAPGSAPAESASQPAPAGAASQSGEKVKIVYWSMFSQGEPLQQLLEQANKDFMAENPDIEVETKWAGREVLTQLQSAIAAGTQVDIVDHSDDRVFNAIVKTGLALPLDTYLAEPAYNSDTVWKDTFNAGVFDGLKGEDGQVYMIPRDDYISAFFYNSSMLNELGIEPSPAGMSWNDFQSMLETIKTQKPDVSPLGADGSIAFYNNWWFTYLAIRLAGPEAFREAAYDKTGEKWSQPEFLQAAQMVRELQDKGYFQKGFEGSVWPAAQVSWVNGDVAMQFMGAWLPKEMDEQLPEDFKIGMFAFPTVEGGTGNDYVEHWANVYGVLKSTQHPDAVARYLKYIMSPEVAARIAELGTPVPLVGAPVPPALEGQYEILKSAKTIPARAGLNTEIPNYMEKVFNACDDQFFKLQIGPEEFINCLQTEGQTFWASQQ